MIERTRPNQPPAMPLTNAQRFANWAAIFRYFANTPQGKPQ